MNAKRFIWLAVVFSVAIGCSKDQQNQSGTNSSAGQNSSAQDQPVGLKQQASAFVTDTIKNIREQIRSGGLYKGKSGIGKDALALSAHTVIGRWEGKSILRKDMDWSGSAGVAGRKDGKLYLFTNSHCLALKELAQCKTPLVYRLEVQFASGKRKPVAYFADHSGDLDLAIIVVEEAGLAEGADYVLLPFDPTVKVSQGDELVAVGTPRGLANTQTFGRVSAIRDRAPNGAACQIIQTDAAINSGNSGGPLFKKEADKYCLVGINTWIFNKAMAEGLNFAIYAGEFFDSQFAPYPADAEGAKAAIKDGRGTAVR